MEYFRARRGEVFWNLGISIKILSKTPEKDALQGKILEIFLQDALKATF